MTCVFCYKQMRVTGANFGVQRVVMFGGVQVTEIASVANHSYIAFYLPPGQGIRNLRVFAGIQVGIYLNPA